MEFVHDRNSNILFSLHDSRIQKVDFQNNTLRLKMNRIFQYTADGKKIFSGDIIFKDSDLDECSYVLSSRHLLGLS